MHRSKIAAVGHYVPARVVTNADLARHMDTTDEWIQERTGIRERRYAVPHEETTTTMAAEAARVACQRAGIEPSEVDFIVFATISPDYYFPGCGVLLQRHLGISHREIPCLDIRNACSGFLYALSTGDQFVKSGAYKNVLVLGAEMQSMGLDFSTRGRNVSVIFGDGAGAVILQPTDEPNSGILATKLHADGTHAEELAMINFGCHGGRWLGKERFGYGEQEFGGVYITQKMVDDEDFFPTMNGQLVFKTAVVKFPEVIREVLASQNLQPSDLSMLIPHQANLRISQFVQKQLGLRDEQVWNNIQRFGNTTAASIPIALSEAWENGRINRGDLVCLAAFGSGFTWGAALLKW